MSRISELGPAQAAERIETVALAAGANVLQFQPGSVGSIGKCRDLRRLTVRRIRAAELRIGGQPAVGEGLGWRRSACEKVIQEVRRVGDVDRVIAVYVRCRPRPDA